MNLPDLPFLEALSETERIHFRNLALLRPQIPTDSQLHLVESLARSLAHPRLLTLIARTPHWLLSGQVVMALAQNEATPESIRRDLEMVVSLVDMMHGLDRAAPGEREEREQVAKEVYAQLPTELKPVVKAQLKQLARQVNPTGTTQELPPLPGEVEDWEALTLPPGPVLTDAAHHTTLEARLERATTTLDPEALGDLLLDGAPEVRAAALHNPVVSEELLAVTLRRCPEPEPFEEIYGEAKWYFREPLRLAMLDAPGCPASLALKLRQTASLLAILETVPGGMANLPRIAAHFTQLDETEYQFVTLWAKRHAPALLRVVKIFYDRLQRQRHTLASGLASRGSEARWASLEERVFMANQATAPDQLLTALRDPDLKVFGMALENPALTPRELLTVIPGLGRDRVEILARHRTWGTFQAIQEALLHNPALGLDTALALLPALSTPLALMDLLRDTRMPHVEVQARALERLRELFAGLSAGDRILLMRSHGTDLIRHLASEVMRDEAMLLQFLGDRQLDPSVLLRLARNKQTPRPVLERIAFHPIPMAHPAIMSELLLNPKTPREASIRVWGLLSESEQQGLLRNPHLPAPLRHLG